MTMREVFLCFILLFIGSTASGFQNDLKKEVWTHLHIDSSFHKAVDDLSISPDSLYELSATIINKSIHLDYKGGIIRGNILKGISFLDNNILDSASFTLLNVLSQINESRFPYEKGLASNIMGSVYTRMNSYQNALTKFTEAEKIFRSINNTRRLTSSLMNIASIHGAQNNYSKALEYLFEAQKLADNPNVTNNTRAGILTNIALIYNMMNKRDDALRYAFASLKIDEHSGIKSNICQSYNVIAGVYNHHNELDSALYYYQKTIDLADPDKREFKPIVFRATQNIATILTQQRKFDEAKVVFQKLKREYAKPNAHQLETALNILAQNHYERENYDSAIFFAQQALTKAKVFNIKIAIRNAYRYLHQSHFKLKRFDSAYFYQSKYYAYNDSIFNEDNQRKFENLRLELETLETQRNLDIALKQNELNKAKSNFLLAIIILGTAVTILGIFVLRNYYKKHQQKLRLEKIALQDKLSKQAQDLHQQALRMIYINNGVKDLEANLKKLKHKSDVGSDVQQLLSSIHINNTLEKEWELFDEYFGHMHFGFIEKFTERCPQVTLSEKRLACLIKMNLTNREIASILNIESASVKMAKHRLKKKLELSDDQDLSSFLATLQLKTEEKEIV